MQFLHTMFQSNALLVFLYQGAGFWWAAEALQRRSGSARDMP